MREAAVRAAISTRLDGIFTDRKAGGRDRLRRRRGRRRNVVAAASRTYKIEVDQAPHLLMPNSILTLQVVYLVTVHYHGATDPEDRLAEDAARISVRMLSLHQVESEISVSYSTPAGVGEQDGLTTALYAVTVVYTGDDEIQANTARA